MGAGCSKGTAAVVTADATTFTSVDNHNSAIKPDTSVDHQKETSHPVEFKNEQTEQKLSNEATNMSNAKPGDCSRGEDTANATENSTTQAQDVDDQSTALLTSFCEKNPKLKSDLRATRDHYKALKEALESGSLMTKEALDHMNGLFTLYTKNSNPAKKVLTDFAVALGIPKLFYDIVVDCRTNCQEVATWDREAEKEQETNMKLNEASASPENQVGRGGQLKTYL